MFPIIFKLLLAFSYVKSATVAAPLNESSQAALDVAKRAGILLNEPGYVLITREGCPFSGKMKDELASKNIMFREINADNISAPAELKEYVRLKGLTFPVVFKDGKYVGDYEKASASLNKEIATTEAMSNPALNPEINSAPSPVEANKPNTAAAPIN